MKILLIFGKRKTQVHEIFFDFNKISINFKTLKIMNLESLNVQELPVKEQMEIDGGWWPLIINCSRLGYWLYSW
ncbi:MAG: hypothetical protein ACK5MD_10460 [Flavobacteriales bacterium]